MNKKIILTEDIPELGRIKGEKAEMLENKKFSYLVRFEDGAIEWIMPTVFEFEN